MSTPARYLLFAQIGFFLSLAVCMLIDPTGLHDNHGWSYYEERDDTLVPYLLGSLGCVLLLVYVAWLLDRSTAPAGFPSALRWLAVFLLLNMATPDTVNSFFFWAHNLTSTLLFLFELGFAIWIVRTLWRTRLAVGLLLLQLLGGIVAMFSQLQLISQLGVGILVFQVSFCTMLVIATARFREAEAVGDESLHAEEISATAVNN